ncbi:peptidylprolyl isomerase [Azospirillum sp. A39]|uniref:peptidylprolyl isomerase n=1 Tax=Azospirillum sp. A39 TaxID=3462279 RepID=UPI0040455C7E
MVHLRAVRSAVAVATACVLVALGPTPAAAQKTGGGGALEGIAAVVNDAAVSMSDVQARVRLSLLNAGVPDSAETRQKILPQVLRQLVDERLQIQEAERLGISVPEADIEAGIARIAEQVRMPVPQLKSFLSQRGVPLSTLNDQVRATIAWQRVMQRRARQEIVVGDDEIDAAVERMKANIGKPEYRVAEIFLSIDRPGQEDEVRRVAERLAEEIRRGANFAAIARQFSQSAGAANGGDIGWVQPGELTDELASALNKLQLGQMSPPVRSAGGYHLLLLRDRRAVGAGATEMELNPPPPPQPVEPPRPDLKRATVDLKQIVLMAPTPADAKATAKQAEAMRKGLKGCAAFDAKAKAVGNAASGDMGTMRVRDMPPQLQQLVVNIPLGEPSPVLTSPGGAIILMVCKRDVPMIAPKPQAAPPPPPKVQAQPARMPTREEIQQDLIGERAELLSRRYLRDLRRAAFVEYRL